MCRSSDALAGEADLNEPRQLKNLAVGAGYHSRLGIKFVIFFVAFYRATLGRLLGGQCRFEPSCSQYMIDAVKKHGTIRGAWRGTKRICRCHPLGGSGYDPA